MKSKISLILFDLDNTLYPASSKLHSRIVELMREQVAEILGVTPEQADADRHEGFLKHGTTARWLLLEKGISAERVREFQEAVHPGDTHNYLEPLPELDKLLAGIEKPKAILTNSTLSHATRVLDTLGVRQHFSHIFDIVFNELEGKPAAGAYQRVLAQLGVEPAEVLFIDDVPSYLNGFRKLGGHTLLVDETGRANTEGHPRITSVFELPSILGEFPI